MSHLNYYNNLFNRTHSCFSVIYLMAAREIFFKHLWDHTIHEVMSSSMASFQGYRWSSPSLLSNFISYYVLP